MNTSNKDSSNFVRFEASQGSKAKAKTELRKSDGIKMKIVTGNLTAGHIGAVVGTVNKGVFVPFFVDIPTKGKLEVRTLKPHVLKSTLAADNVAVLYLLTLFDSVKYTFVMRVRPNGSGELVTPITRQVPLILGPNHHLEQIAKWADVPVRDLRTGNVITALGRDPFDGKQDQRVNAVTRAKQRDSVVLNDLGLGGFDALGLIWEKVVVAALHTLQGSEFLRQATETAAVPTYHLAADKRPMVHVGDQIAKALAHQKPVTTPQTKPTAAQIIAATDDIPPAPPIPPHVKPLAEATDEDLVAPLPNAEHVAPADLAPDPVSAPVAGTPVAALEPEAPTAPAVNVVWPNAKKEELEFWSTVVTTVLKAETPPAKETVMDMIDDWYSSWVSSGGPGFKVKNLSAVRQRAFWAHPLMGVAMVLVSADSVDNVIEDDRLARAIEEAMTKPLDAAGFSVNDLLAYMAKPVTA